MSDQDQGPIEHEGRTTRRQMLFRLGAVGAGVVFTPSLLAACGGDNKDSNSGGATTAGAATTTAGGATTAAGGGGASGDVGTQLAQMLKVDPAHAGKGVDWKLGSVLALTGTGSFYGKTMSRGTDLAVEHIKAAGGPNISVKYYDHKSGDASAGRQAAVELGENHYPAKLASYGDDLTVMIPYTAQYKTFTLDGGGGTGIAAQGKDYFWGTRAITPNDPMPGLFQYLKETSPNAKKIGVLFWDLGEPSNSLTKEDILKKVAAAELTHNGLYELVPPGTQDYSQILPKIKANEPDVLLTGLYGQDPGSFMNQLSTAGLKSQIVGFEFTPDGVNASKGAFDKDGWTFAYDYFDASNPISPLAKLFVAEFKKKYGELPDFYAANFYENTLVMWEVIRRVLAKGGDINDGAQLDAALRENLTVVSVYGGDATSLGSYTLDPVSHSVQKRTMGVFTYKGGKVTPHVFFGIGGADYKKV